MKGNIMGDFDWYSIAFIVLLGCLLFFLSKKWTESIDQERRSTINITRMVNALPEEKKAPFLMELNTVKKDPKTAALLAFFLGWVGAHKFYLGQTGLGIAYLLFFWTTIPRWISLIEISWLPGKTAQYNEKKCKELYQKYTGTYPVRY
jgi:TM2 domain-containing membrane protein YozV